MPRGERLARDGDQARIMTLFKLAHRENGWGGMDEAHVADVIDKAANGQGGYVIAIADGQDEIEAVIGLTLTRIWYNTDEDWFWAELIVYVHPAHRRGTRHAVALMQFAQWWAKATGQPVIINMAPVEGFARKARFFGLFGTPFSMGFSVGRPLRRVSREE